jgi:uncharacterized protein DUF1566
MLKTENIIKMKRFIYTLGLILLLPICLMAGPVPDTGQTDSYTDTFGEDSDYTRIPPSYTKLDSAGAELPDTATSWAMVRDNVTGLIWEAKGAGDGTANYSDPNDTDNTYTWYDSTLGTFPGTPGAGTDTEDFITDLNAANYGGQNDWRLPSARELKSIVDYNGGNPSINQTYFSNTFSWSYWSSTPNADTSGLYSELDDRGAWRVRFNTGGHVRISPSGTLLYARAVRGVQNDANDFVDNGDGTITDFSTGLMWVQDHAVTPMNWEAAIAHSEGLEFADYDDWWLPNTNELQSIVDFGSYDPVAIDTTFFPLTEPFQYWSSTTYAVNSGAAWFVNFDDGIMQSLSSSTNKSEDMYYVRAVRGANVETIDLGGGEEIVLESEPGTVLSNVQTVTPPAPLPDDATFPYDLIGFQIDGVPSGSMTLGSTTLTMTLPAGAAPTNYYKYGPEPGNATDHWYEFLYDEATATGAVIEGNVITLHLGDGVRGDSDLTDDDTIIDPGGPVVEPNVKLVQVGEDTIMLKSESGTTLSSCSSVTTPADPPADTSFPYGLLAYEISGVPSGSLTLGSTTLEITLPPGAYPTSYYQYGPTSGDPTDHWYEDVSAVINGNVITLNLVNGGWGDCDLNADTDVILVDPPRGSGPALEANAASISSLDGNDTILLESPVGTALSNVQAIDNPSPGDTPVDAEFPYGVFTFQIEGSPSGSMILDSTTLI